VCSRAPDLRPGIVEALIDLNGEGVGSFSNTKRENFQPVGLSDFWQLASPDVWLAGLFASDTFGGSNVWRLAISSVDFPDIWERKWEQEQEQEEGQF
jgi:hypothetical protein